MDAKREAMIPTPPRPAHAELDIPIRFESVVVSSCQEDDAATVAQTVVSSESA